MYFTGLCEVCATAGCRTVDPEGYFFGCTPKKYPNNFHTPKLWQELVSRRHRVQFIISGGAIPFLLQVIAMDCPADAFVEPAVVFNIEPEKKTRYHLYQVRPLNETTRLWHIPMSVVRSCRGHPTESLGCNKLRRRVSL